MKWRLVVGGSAAALALALAPVIARAARTVATRLRIHRLRSSLSALSLHAATARGIGQYLGNIRDQDTRERIHSLQKIQRRAIAGLEAARSHVDRHLLALLDGGAFCGGKGDAAVRSTERRVRIELAAEIALASRLVGASAISAVAPAAPPPRHALLRKEQRALAELCNRPHPRQPKQPRELKRAVNKLRALESKLDFQAELLAEVRRTAESSGYSGENFAYGSTPLQSWLALFESRPVQEALAAAGDTPPRFAVLGSSLGSLVVYGACVHGLPSHGIELLPYLAAQAASVVRAAGVRGATFECADMLTCDLSQFGIVMLASQCWDEPLLESIGSKLMCRA